MREQLWTCYWKVNRATRSPAIVRIVFNNINNISKTRSWSTKRRGLLSRTKKNLVTSKKYINNIFKKDHNDLRNYQIE